MKRLGTINLTKELTKTQQIVLRALCERQHQMLSELAISTQKSPKAVSDSVKLLEVMGYVISKTAEDEPGRPKYVSLTATGKRMCKELLEGRQNE
jgi:DNA-binding MarR family transcriptional regulator